MRSDSDIQLDVAQALRWDPRLREDDVCVAVKGGVVVLGGFTHSYGDKVLAEQVVSEVRGVQAVANEITVRLPCTSARLDAEIAHAAVHALTWNTSVPADCLHVVVENGWVKLNGDVDWYFQKEEAERAVRDLRGVRGVTNLVMVKPRPVASDVKEQITRALHRGVAFDAAHIAVDIVDHQATLSGSVRSFVERRDAERAARNAPGVTDVDNRLTVEPDAMATVL
jgi:osmotically-inducible protein OsmY